MQWSVCPIDRPQQRHVVGLLLGATQAGDIDRQRWRSAANADSVTFSAAVEG